MKVLYVNYINMNETSTGSGVRPIKIFEAMKKLGYNIDMISGPSRFKQRKSRKNQIKNVMDKIKSKYYDFCYIEPPSGIISRFYNNFEYSLFKKLKKYGIPTGIFYRDIYWKFAKDFNIPFLKRIYIKFMQSRDYKVLKKNMDIFFLPSLEMGKHIDFKKQIALPPGCEILVEKPSNIINNKIVYVGATNYNYGTDILLDAMKIVNKSKKIELNLVCRKDEAKAVYDFKNSENADWLNIFHLKSDELSSVYSNADFAVYSSRASDYFNFAMPIKIFEYISYLKPIAATCCKGLANVISSNDLGKIALDNSESLASSIISMYDNMNKYNENIIEFRKNNLWVHRVEKISQELLVVGKLI